MFVLHQVPRDLDMRLIGSPGMPARERAVPCRFPERIFGPTSAGCFASLRMLCRTRIASFKRENMTAGNRIRTSSGKSTCLSDLSCLRAYD
jgi:hypothetical protein